MNKIIKLLALMAFLSLGACSLGWENDYHSDGTQASEAAIDVPEEYATTDMEQDYPIPSVVANKSAQKLSSLEPPKS